MNVPRQAAAQKQVDAHIVVDGQQFPIDVSIEPCPPSRPKSASKGQEHDVEVEAHLIEEEEEELAPLTQTSQGAAPLTQTSQGAALQENGPFDKYSDTCWQHDSHTQSPTASQEQESQVVVAEGQACPLLLRKDLFEEPFVPREELVQVF